MTATTANTATDTTDSATDTAQSIAPRTVGMIDARRRDSASKRAHVQVTVDRMLADGTPISFAAVARHAGVSTWLVYAPGVRDTIQAARTRQQAEPAADRPAVAADPNLHTDLALARAEIKQLRAERDQQHQQLRLALGARLDNLAKADLMARVDELTQANTELTTALAQAQADNQALHARLNDVEDDLAAARTSLRRMIRSENLPPTVAAQPNRPTS